MKAVQALSDEDKITPPAVVVAEDGEEIEVPADAWKVSFTYSVSGQEVDVIQADDVMITVQRA